jgi:hypothetical protein
MAPSECTVENIVPEDVRGYIDHNDMLRKLRRLFPSVTDDKDFKVDVSLLS